MTQPLHYTPKAIKRIQSHYADHAPGMAAGFRYIAGTVSERGFVDKGYAA